MSFEACERRILTHSVPFPRVGMVGAWGFVMSYFIVFLLFRRLLTCNFLQSYNCFLKGYKLLILYIYY